MICEHLISIRTDVGAMLHGYVLEKGRPGSSKVKRGVMGVTQKMFDHIEQNGLPMSLPIVLVTTLDKSSSDVVRPIFSSNERCKKTIDNVLEGREEFGMVVATLDELSPESVKLMELH